MSTKLSKSNELVQFLGPMYIISLCPLVPLLLHPGLLALISWFVTSVHFTTGHADLFLAVAVITPHGIRFVADVYQTKHRGETLHPQEMKMHLARWEVFTRSTPLITNGRFPFDTCVRPVTCAACSAHVT